MEHANIQMVGWIYIQVCISEEVFRLQRERNREGVTLQSKSGRLWGQFWGTECRVGDRQAWVI